MDRGDGGERLVRGSRFSQVIAGCGVTAEEDKDTRAVRTEVRVG